MAEETIPLPTTPEPPGQATLYTAEKTTTVPDTGGEVTTTDIEFDYSSHLDRIVTALEQISSSMAFIADRVDNISIQQTTLAAKTTLIESHQARIKELAETTGIKSMSPYDLLSAASMYTYYTDNGSELDVILNKISTAPIDKLQSIRDAIVNLPKLP